MYRKRILSLLLAASCITGIYARSAFYNGDEYSLTAVFAEEVDAGDPVFVRLTVFFKEEQDEVFTLDASMEGFSKTDQKIAGKAPLYTLQSSRSQISVFGGFPVSTYIKHGAYILSIEYSVSGGKRMKIELPFVIRETDFIKETIVLDDANTEIKTDMSEERLGQILALQKLLAEKNYSSVFAHSAFSLPVNSLRRTSFFGDRRTYEYTNGKTESSLHYGIDFGVSENTAVTACARGKVVMAEYRISTGWTVVIEHLPGLYSLYYHLNSLNTDSNTIVERSQIIGYSGSTGLSTGPHLHWEIRLSGEAVNPDFFTGRFSQFF